MTPTDKAKQYSKDVIAGKIPNCKWVILACKRFQRDLKRQNTSDFPYIYDPEKADRAVRFMELMPHTKGKWASDNQKLILQSWQCFIECNIFGWVRRDTGKRRFRMSFELIPRKSGKSIRVAARGIYLFAADGETGAEIYSGATSEKQAFEVYKPAWIMVSKLDGLRAKFGIEQSGNPKNPGTMFVMRDMSKFEVMIGKPGDGASPHGAIIDEYHEHDSDHMVDTMQTGMGAREQPLLSVITTAGSNLGGPCYEMQQDMQRILEGVVIDETVFCIMFGIDNESHEMVYQLSQAIERIGIECQKHRVPAEVIARCIVEGYAKHAMQESQGKEERPQGKNVLITGIDQIIAEAFANPAITHGSSKLTRSLKSDSINEQPSGEKQIQRREGQFKKNITQSQDIEKQDIPTSSDGSTELKKQIMICYTLAKKGSAGYAESLSTLYALIIAMQPGILEDYCAKNAILGSVFLETLKKLLEMLSNISKVTSLSLKGLQLKEKIPPDNWDSVDSIIKANPNYGISVFPEFLLSQLDQAKRSASKQNAFRTKHLNEWVGAKTAWMNMVAWQKQRRDMKMEDFKGCKCQVSVDLASKKDVVAVDITFFRDEHYYSFKKFFAPEAAAEENEKYMEFVSDGCLELTDGAMVDQEVVEDYLEFLKKEFNPTDFAFDEWQADYMMTRLMGKKFEVVKFPFRLKYVSEPMKQLEALVLNGTYWHDGNKMMTWMMSNVAAKMDLRDNIYPNKARPNDPKCKIDGVAAAIMSVGRFIVEEQPKAEYSLFFV